MSDDVTLHLCYKPMDGIINEVGAEFLGKYSRRYYPRVLRDLAGAMRDCAVKLVKYAKAGAYEYSALHYTDQATGRFTFEEFLKDAKDPRGLQISLQPSTSMEKDAIAKCHVNSETRTKPVVDVIAYLEDSLETEAERWINAQTFNEHDATTVLTQLLCFLKEVKSIARVMDFSLVQQDDGMELMITLVSPDVYGYYTRIDWKII